MSERMTIIDYLQKCYEIDISLVDAFFISSDVFGYVPVDTANFRQIISETIEDYFDSFLIRQRINRTIRREEYKINGLWLSTTYTDDYSPIENVFETNTETVTRTPDLTYEDNGGNSIGEQTNTGDVTDKLYAFNSSGFSDTDFSENSQTMGERSDTHNNTRTETGEEVTVYEKSRHGNIGTVTAADLLKGQRDAVRYDFYWEVAKMLVDSFALDCEVI